jgi:hypothetical protein
MARRKMATTSLCQICGQEEEDTFHIFMRCPHARSLWLAMKEVWELPSDDMMKQTGTEWLLQLLTSISENQRVHTMMIVWRVWHNHNEMTHDKPCPSIEGSRRFLISYIESLFLIKQHPVGDIAKGKMVVDPYAGFKA